ncbi:MAG: glutamate racemase [Lachnospiraceae bacterium]
MQALSENGRLDAPAERNAPIGVFDSGVGGLTVVREIMRQIPEEPIVYFGDTARVPYGGKSRETILRYSRQIIRFLKTQHVKAIVVACNTASAFALEEIRQELDLPIIGVVLPGARVAGEVTKNGRIGVIGTKGTIHSGLYREVILNEHPTYEVFGKACPLFAPLVEEHLLDDSVTFEMARRYLKELQECDIDTLVLGCTHYPLLRSTIRQVMGDKVTLVNPAYETAIELRQLLRDHRLSFEGEPLREKYQFFVSDDPATFREFADTILPCPTDRTRQICIDGF